MIYTLTLNPALDKNAKSNGVEPEKKTRCFDMDYEPGGGGINVSRAIHKIGGESKAIFPSGGHTGILLQQLLMEEGIQQITTEIEGFTRANLNVTDVNTLKQYRFISPGAAISQDSIDSILDLILKLDDCEYLVISGSLPPDTPIHTYADIVNKCTEANIKVIVDTSGQALLDTLELCHIYLAKPNLNELCELAQCEMTSINDAERIARKVMDEKNIDNLVISLGPQGAFVVNHTTFEHIVPPPIKPKSTVGAGDSMVAGITLHLSEGNSLREAARFGMACGTAATLNFGSDLCKLEDVEELYKIILEKNPLLV